MTHLLSFRYSNIIRGLCSCLLFLFSINSMATERTMALNDAVNLSFNDEIGTVFISSPTVADYKIIDPQQLVLFANQVGDTTLIVYSTQNKVLLSQRISVNIDLKKVRRQLTLRYPQFNLTLNAVGNQVAVRGQVDTAEQRDDIYQVIGTLLNRPTKQNNDTNNDDDDKNALNEPQWDSIINGITVAEAQQVNVKITVAQVTKEFNETIGVDWPSIGSGLKSFSLFQYKFNNLSSVISAIANDSIAEVLAEPNLTVLSGESAKFLVGGEVPMITHDNNQTSISFKKYGISLDLTAKVLNNHKIKLKLAPEVSAVEKIIKSNNLEVPQMITRRAETTVELADGQSFMLGGLMSKDDQETTSKVPLLGDIPVIGGAFRSVLTRRAKTELVIIATVNLVHPVATTDIRLPHIQKTNTLKRLFNVSISQPYKTEHNTVTTDFLNKAGFIQ
ncbi:pilus assembly protein CpaC [Photobacterium carnosum]|uniref:type II and III secretion system protein family protein n=1 Tax=Photobacterium carnosum TaxID=2023717 RepID=UPI001C8FF5E1|nr:pilus assembly protein N-terminal domain-containing protein [Photobacterium carnosum]MBY3787045.1 pilus assembly protein CpaC [Photobacterium carnosum]MCD9532748.1 pilus assembly protein CpaC [Photobacterium carnosum]